MNIAFKRAFSPVVVDIPGFPLYRIDENGNVYSARRKEVRRLRPGLAGNGYLTVALYGKSYYIHRLMQLAFFTAAAGLVMNHKDGAKTNNRLSNLEEVTWSQNNAHAMRTGLRRPPCLKGEAIGTSKLTSVQVQEIRIRSAAGLTDTALGREYSVSRSTIRSIRTGSRWNHL